MTQTEAIFAALTHLYQCRWLPEFGVDLHSNARCFTLAFHQTFRSLLLPARDPYHLLNNS
jgi:hypothetical protein